MVLAGSRSLSSIRRRSLARTDAISPAYAHSTTSTYAHSTQKKAATPTETAAFPSHIIHRKSKHRKKLFINSVNRITIQKSLDIINCNIHNSLSGSLSSPGNMRSNNAVLSLKKRVIPLDRLSRNNIKTSSINLTTIQSICQILLNNKLTTAVVDKDNSILLPLFAGTITSPG